MAGGLGQSGGVFAVPPEQALGFDNWAMMSGVHPASPLVGGRGGDVGYAGINVTGRERQVAVAQPSQVQSSVQRAHFSELWNFSGNPIGWVLIAAIVYLGLAHISLQASLRGRAGKARGGLAAGIGSG